jgi:hypothetical protein
MPTRQASLRSFPFRFPYLIKRRCASRVQPHHTSPTSLVLTSPLSTAESRHAVPAPNTPSPSFLPHSLFFPFSLDLVVYPPTPQSQLPRDFAVLDVAPNPLVSFMYKYPPFPMHFPILLLPHRSHGLPPPLPCPLAFLMEGAVGAVGNAGDM